MKTIEGTKRYLITRTTTEEPDTFEALPREFRDTISEVHFADGSGPDLLGQQGPLWTRSQQALDLPSEFLVQLAMLGVGENHEVFDAIVEFVSVDVMDMLFSVKAAA